MKRIICPFIAVLLLLLTAFPVFADGAGPAFTSYTVRCPKDITLYESDWENETMKKINTIPAGTMLDVNHEFETNGVLYGSVQYDDVYGYIRISDVQLNLNSFRAEQGDVLDKGGQVKVIAKNGVKMYAGPNDKYPLVTTVPKNVVLTYNIGNERYDTSWAYVTYRGQSGWIAMYEFDMKDGVVNLPDEKDVNEIWVLEDGVHIYKELKVDNYVSEGESTEYLDLDSDTAEPSRVVGTAKKGEKYTYKFFQRDYNRTWYYISNGLRSGWILDGIEYANKKAVAHIENDYSDEYYMPMHPFSLKLYDSPKGKKATTVNVSAGQKLSPEFEYSVNENDGYYTRIYLTVNGQSGWCDDHALWENVAAKTNSIYNEAVKKNTRPTEIGAEGGTPFYTDDTRTKQAGVLPQGKKAVVQYEHWDYTDEGTDESINLYYIEYGGKAGWADEDTFFQEVYDEDEEFLEEETLEEETWEEPWQEEIWAEETYDSEADASFETNESAPAAGMSPTQIVLLCVGGAVVLALTAGVTFLLIRRKRKAGQTNENPHA